MRVLIGEKTKVPGAICPTQGHIAEKYTRVVVVGGWSKEAVETWSLADGRDKTTSGWVFGAGIRGSFRDRKRPLLD